MPICDLCKKKAYIVAWDKDLEMYLCNKCVNETKKMKGRA